MRAAMVVATMILASAVWAEDTNKPAHEGRQACNDTFKQAKKAAQDAHKQAVCPDRKVDKAGAKACDKAAREAEQKAVDDAQVARRACLGKVSG
jgi:hypothetical protein